MRSFFRHSIDRTPALESDPPPTHAPIARSVGIGRAARALGFAIGLSSLAAAGSVHAQTPTSGSSTTAEARRQAGEAFDRGTSAMLANDFRAAAHFFEQAYRLAPAAVALKQAIRAQDRAGNAFRAANLALRLRDQYPNDADGQNLATDVLGRFAAQFTEVHAACDGCAVLVNDALVSDNVHGTVRFFIQPSTAATITGSFATGNVSAQANGPAGTTVELPAFVAPPPPPEPEHPPQVGPVAENGGGTPPWLFYTAVGATAAVGGVTIWSGIDTRSGVGAYEDAVAAGDVALATQLLADGQDKERRTNILIGATGGVAAITVVFAIITDWDGDPEAPAATTARRRVQQWAGTVEPTSGGLTAVVGGRF